jgi:cytochrome P450
MLKKIFTKCQSFYEQWNQPSPPFVSFYPYDGAQNPAERALAIACATGPLVKISPIFSHYLLTDPQAIKTILVTEAESYDKYYAGYHRLADILGQGLLIQMGSVWEKNRQLLQPLFHKKNLNVFFEICKTHTENALNTLEHYSNQNQALDMHQWLMELVLAIAFEFLTGSLLAPPDIKELINHFTQAQRCAYYALSLKRWVITPKNVHYHRVKRLINQFFNQLLAAPPTKHLNFLNFLREQHRDSPQGKSAILAELKTFLITGHETIGNGLTWALYLLSQHPLYQESIEQESRIDTISAFDYIEGLEKTKYIWQESMRLYPPIWSFARRAIESVEVAGFSLPKGSIIMISPYVLHRLPLYWQEPSLFRPQRFLEKPFPQKFTYLPFGAGPHICIASNVANWQAQYILSLLCKNFTFIPTHPHRDIPLELLITLRPKVPLYLKPIRR